MSVSTKVLIDFDGTITLRDSVDALLETFASAGWMQAEDEWIRGVIGSDECMARQARLICASADEIERFSDAIELDAGLAEVLRICAESGADCAIVSDGYDYVIRRSLLRLRLSCAVAANRLTYMGDRRWDLESPFASPSCDSRAGTCKCALAGRGRLILIGDGRSDFCVASRADFVFAKGRLVEHCQDRGITHEPFGRLADILPVLSDILIAVPPGVASPGVLQ